MKSYRGSTLISLIAISTLLPMTACDDDGPQEWGSVEVVYNDTTVVVDLADAEVVDFDGSDVARLSELVELADLGVDLESLEFDFEADDGFLSSSSSNCVDFVPVPGAALEDGYIELSKGDLYWEESLGFPGCLRVKGMVRILASDATAAAGAEVDVSYGDETVTVDLSALDTVDIDGAAHVLVSDVVDAADLGVDLESLEFDFEASDGFRASNSGNCADFVPVAGVDLAQGYIDVATRDLTWDDELGFPGCLRVDDLAQILASDAG